MPFHVLLRRSLRVRSPGWGRADCDAGRYSLCDGDSSDADIDCYANTWNRNGYGDVRNHANAHTYAFNFAFSDRGSRDFDVNPYKHSDANSNSDANGLIS